MHGLASQMVNPFQLCCMPFCMLRICEHLGTGNFGQVNKGVWESPSGSTEVTVKALRPGASEIDRVKFLQEAAIMGQFHHPNVIALHGVVTVVDPVSGSSDSSTYHVCGGGGFLKTGMCANNDT